MRNRTLHDPFPPLSIAPDGVDEPAGAGGPADDEARARARGDLIDPPAPPAPPEPDPTEGKTPTELAEEAAEGEETPEERAQREAEEAEAERAKRIRVPKHRLDEVVAKSRAREEALLARIAELERQQAEPAAGKPKDVLAEMRARIDELQDKYEELLFEGEKEKAREVRRQLEEARDRYTDTKVAAGGAAARAQTIESLKYEAALAKVEADYPALNPDSGQFDEARATEVAELMQMMAAQGLTRQAALERAVRYVMGAPTARTPSAAEAAAEAARIRREQDGRKRAAEAVAKQPPNTARAGTDNGRGGEPERGIDVFRLSQQAFERLSAEEVARLRGDEL